MKKVFLLLAVMVINGLLVASSFGADKLIVQDGSNTKFVVTDDAKLGLNIAAPNYLFDLASNNQAISSMHFSKDGTDSGGYLTSVLPNNFFVSSGAAYDGTLPTPGWVAKAPSAVAAGSGAVGYRVLMSNACTVGQICALNAKLTLDYNGNLTITGALSQSSSRDYKDNIQTLSADEALDALKKLTPVTYNYRNDEASHVGFIAEDVPDLLASKDRKTLSPMDIVAVLTKALQEQSKIIDALSAKIEKLEKASRD
jgi:hypothetical protein